MQIIDRLEPVARGFYAGSVAHIEFDGDLDSCIILRSVAVANGRAYWQASAGIVADSVPRTEYAEVFAKTAIVRAVLGIDVRRHRERLSAGGQLRLVHLESRAPVRRGRRRGRRCDPQRRRALGRRRDGALRRRDRRARARASAEAGRTMAIVREAARVRRPLFGVCLDCRRSARRSAGRVVHRRGRCTARRRDHARRARRVRELPSPFTATRYHSLVVDHDGFPAELRANAASEDGVIQGLAHRELPISGVQFHRSPC